MKSLFLDNSLSLIKRYYPDYDELKMAELKYGLEGLYLSVTKLIFIFIVSIILGIFKETLLLLIFFNILRFSGFGLHASKSYICLIVSSTMFIGGPLLAQVLNLSIISKTIIGIISIILIFIHAPADTKKRPLLNKKKRNMYKFITTINCIILVIISLIIKDTIISNLIVLGILYEVIMISPVTYKIFKLPYNNYKTYKYWY